MYNYLFIYKFIKYGFEATKPINTFFLFDITKLQI